MSFVQNVVDGTELFLKCKGNRPFKVWLAFTNDTLNSRFASKWEVVGHGNILLKA